MKHLPKKKLLRYFSLNKKPSKNTNTGHFGFDNYEQQIIKNLGALRYQTVEDVMVPKADINAIEVGETLENAAAKFSGTGHQRLPIYRDTLDDSIGLVWVQDILSWRNGEIDHTLSQMVRPVLFVSPFMGVLELLMEMRIGKRHMALVVDEFGGVDGLVTLGTLISEVIGEIKDESHQGHQILYRLKGQTPELHARLSLEELEKYIGTFLSEDEREDIDTVGGLIFSLAGRVPTKGEIISHPSGLEFEIIGVDPRRVHWARLMGNVNNKKIIFNAP